MGSVELLLEKVKLLLPKGLKLEEIPISAVCVRASTFQAITIWREELLDEKIMLRDVIDLDATFGSMSESDLPEEVKIEDFENQNPPSEIGGDNLLAEEFNKTKEKKSSYEKDDGPESLEDEENEDFEEDHANVSLAAMESSLKPQVLKTLRKLQMLYSKLLLQNNRMLAAIKEKAFSESEEKKYQNLRNDIVKLVNSLHLHNNRIEALIDQLYGINRKIMGLDGALVKLADKSRINRKEFIQNYKGSELDPVWLEKVSKFKSRGWENFAEKFGDKIDEIRTEIAEIGQYIGIDISEFRRIVQQVQKVKKKQDQLKRKW